MPEWCGPRLVGVRKCWFGRLEFSTLIPSSVTATGQRGSGQVSSCEGAILRHGRRDRVTGRVVRWASQLWGAGRRVALDLLFPPRCTWCDADLTESHGPLLCPRCCQILQANDWQFCRRCGLKTSELGPSGPNPGEEGCLQCRRRRRTVDAVVPLGPYDGELRQAVLRMKRVGGERLAEAVGTLLYHRRRAEIEAFRADVVLPIPMHWRRRMARGIDGVDILAEVLARELHLPVLRGLVRVRNTHLQRDLLPGERFRNLRGALRVRSVKPIQGRRVLLVDDIMTTGATCAEAARTLREAGAAAVAAAVVARAEPDRRKGFV